MVPEPIGAPRNRPKFLNLGQTREGQQLFEALSKATRKALRKLFGCLKTRTFPIQLVGCEM
jgi:hypothetical protein